MANKKSHGFRARTRDKLTLKERLTIDRILEKPNVGDKVVIKINPSFHKGMPHPRFYGRVGVIEGFRGDACIVKIIEGKKIKRIISHAVHLKRLV